MPTIGYHASHEQFAPSELLACVRTAERAGFAAVAQAVGRRLPVATDMAVLSA